MEQSRRDQEAMWLRWSVLLVQILAVVGLILAADSEASTVPGACESELARFDLKRFDFLEPAKSHPYPIKLLKSLVRLEPDSKKLLEKLKTPPASELEKRWRQVMPELESQWGYYSHKSKSDYKGEYFLAVGLFYEPGDRTRPVGLAARHIFVDKNGEVGSEADGIYRDPNLQTPGIGKAVKEVMLNWFYPILGVKYQIIMADYSGRLAWSLQNTYEFYPKKGLYRAHFFDLDSEALSTRDLIRKSFLRYLNAQDPKLEIRDLRHPGFPENHEVSIEDLNTPFDFASVEHKDGRLIETPVLRGHGVVDEGVLLPVGRSFALWDYRPVDGEERVNGSMRMMKKYSPIAMPIWKGIVYFD